MDSFRLDFVGVGPQRTGTSWLHQLLQHHPALCFPKDVKETMFFDQYYEKGLDWYVSYFTHYKSGQLRGEIGPTYFDAPSVPALIHNLNPACKIIVNLRDPIERAFSLYLHHQSRGRLDVPFREAASKIPRIVEAGRYAVHIPRWLETFGEKQVSILFLEDIDAQPQGVLKETYDFLGVEAIEMPEEGNEKIGALMTPRFGWLGKVGGKTLTWLRSNRFHGIVETAKRLGVKKVYTQDKSGKPELDTDDRRWLLKQYEQDIVFVEKLTGRDLVAWRG